MASACGRALQRAAVDDHGGGDRDKTNRYDCRPCAPTLGPAIGIATPSAVFRDTNYRFNYAASDPPTFSDLRVMSVLSLETITLVG